MSVKTLERCFNESVDREMSNIVDTVEDSIQNAILTAIENIVAPKIDLAIRSISASSGRDVTSVSANSERREQVGISTSFENASENNDTLGVSNVNDETRQNIPDEVSELSVSETRFDRQPHTHHTRQTGQSLEETWNFRSTSSELLPEVMKLENAKKCFLFGNPGTPFRKNLHGLRAQEREVSVLGIVSITVFFWKTFFRKMSQFQICWQKIEKF